MRARLTQALMRGRPVNRLEVAAATRRTLFELAVLIVLVFDLVALLVIIGG